MSKGGNVTNEYVTIAVGENRSYGKKTHTHHGRRGGHGGKTKEDHTGGEDRLAPNWAPITRSYSGVVTKATGRAAASYLKSQEHLLPQLTTAETWLGFTRNRSAPTYRTFIDVVAKVC